MHLWCPECGGTSFFYTTIDRKEDKQEGTVILTDQMKCKKCSKEFKIEWYDHIRNSWIELQPKIFKKRFA